MAILKLSSTGPTTGKTATESDAPDDESTVSLEVAMKSSIHGVHGASLTRWDRNVRSPAALSPPRVMLS